LAILVEPSKDSNPFIVITLYTWLLYYSNMYTAKRMGSIHFWRKLSEKF